MKLTLCGATPSFPDGWDRLSIEVEPKQLVADVVKIWTEKGKKVQMEIHCELFDLYLPEASANRRPWKVDLQILGDNWMVIHWCDRQSCEPLLAGTVFAYRKNVEDEFNYFLVPENFTVNPQNGDITTEYAGEELRFPAWTGAWPDQLVNLRKEVAVGILHMLLTPADDNPLTMLVSSNHQPCKGAAKQVVARLLKILAFLN